MSNRSHHVSSASSSKSSRQRLTEAEREERRVRRLLANRESASRTVQRRRAMHEELMKNATELAMENQNLKREREQASEEFNDLKRTNECLKAMMAQEEKAVVNIHQGDTEPGTIAPPTCQQPFYWFFPPQNVPRDYQSWQQNPHPLGVQNEECSNLLTTPSASDRKHEGGIDLALKESGNDWNRGEGMVFKPTPVNCFGQSSLSSSVGSLVFLDKKLAAREARRRRKELNRLRSLYSSKIYS